MASKDFGGDSLSTTVNMPRKGRARLSSSSSSSSDTESDPEFKRIKVPKHLRAKSPEAQKESSPSPGFPSDKESVRASTREMGAKLQAAIDTARGSGRSRSKSGQVYYPYNIII